MYFNKIKFLNSALFNAKLFKQYLVLSLSLLTLQGQANEKDIVAIPADQLAFDKTPEGVEFAKLIGDRFNESYMTMVRLPAGLVSPPHIKSANMFGVMLSGTMTHIAIGDKSKEPASLSRGSFYKIPAGIAHVSSCISDTDCVTFLYQDGPFDFQVINP